MLWRALANQIHSRLGHFRQIGGLSVTVHVHVKDAWTFKEKVIMDRGNLKPVIEQSGHDWIHLVFLKHEITHHYVHSTVALGQREPSSEAKGRRCRDAIDRDLQVVPGDVNLQNSVFEVSLFAHG